MQSINRDQRPRNPVNPPAPRGSPLACPDMTVVRGTSLSNYPGLVTELGGDPTALLRAAGIRLADVGKQDAFVPLHGAIAAIESAAIATHTPDFGRRLAQRQGIEILGPVGVAARTAATVADALRIFGTFMAAYSPALSLEVVSEGTAAQSFLEFQIHLTRLPPHNQVMELSLGVMVKVLRLLLGSQYSPLSVHLPHQPLTSANDYMRYFGCRAYFAQPAAGVSVRSIDLQRPLHHDALTHQAVVEYLITLVGPAGSDRTDSVRTLVRRLLPTGAVTLEVIAAQFNLHPKTLQRRLATEGTSFSTLVDDVRREAAEHYLRDTDIDLSHLSRELGYTEQSALTRSCKRWFGTGPFGYRRAVRSAQRPAASLHPAPVP